LGQDATQAAPKPYDAGRGLAEGGSWAVSAEATQSRRETGKSIIAPKREPARGKSPEAKISDPMKDVFIWRLLVPPPAGGASARLPRIWGMAGGGRRRYRVTVSV